MYSISSWLVVVVLYFALIVSIFIGYWCGSRIQSRYDASSRGQISSLRASMMGFLALLIGFTFSQSLQHYVRKCEAVIDEANAIGTAYLRADFLSESEQGRARQLFSEYVDLRIRESQVSSFSLESNPLNNEAAKKQDRIWAGVVQLTKENNSPSASLYAASVNEMIDSFSSRNAEVDRHVPETALLIMFVTFALTVFLVGFSSGVDAHLPSTAAQVAIVVIVLLVYVNLDLEHPRHGLIKVPHDALLALQTQIEGDLP